MKVSDVVNVLEEEAPAKDALDWDNVGLLVGSMDWEVSRIYVALDATDEVIAHAIDAKADLIVTHHPMIFKNVNRVVEGDFVGRRILKLIEHHIACFAMHTNFDIHRMGKLAEEKLGLSHTIALEPCEIDGEVDVNVGLGRIGSLLDKPTTLEEYAWRVRESFELPYVRVYGEAKQMIHTIAICPGSGRSEIKNALAAGADLLITGDIDHHSGIDAVAQNLAIIDAGHYGVEHIFIAHVKDLLSEETGLPVMGEEKKMPYWLSLEVEA